MTEIQISKKARDYYHLHIINGGTDTEEVPEAYIKGYEQRMKDEKDEWIELKNEPNEVPEMDCYFYNKTVGVVFITKDEYVKIGLYTHYVPANLPSPPKTK